MEILGRKVNDVYNVCRYHLNCSPGRLELKKNKYIHLLKSLRPHGLNTVNPFVVLCRLFSAPCIEQGLESCGVEPRKQK